MKYILSLFILILSFSKMNMNAIFPTVPSAEELNCTRVANPQSKEDCTSKPTSDTQYACCLVKGVGLNKCVYAEDTEFGIKSYKHIYSEVDDFTIQCGANHLKNIFVLFFLLIIEYL